MIEVLKQALEALEESLYATTDKSQFLAFEAITSLRQAIAELESQKPVAYLNPDDLCAETAFRWCKIDAFTKPVYTHPPQRKPLTDEQILANETLRYHFGLNGGAGPVSKKGRAVIDAIEAAHGIKE